MRAGAYPPSVLVSRLASLLAYLIVVLLWAGPGFAKAPRRKAGEGPAAAPSSAPASAPGEPAPPVAGRGPALRVLALDPKKPKSVYKLNTAPGLATVIQLPEPWAVMPTCGDCVFGDAVPAGQLYRIDVLPETRTLSIKPTRLPSVDLPPSSFVTNIDVALQGGISVTFFVELTLPESADARVELTIPGAETSEAKLSIKERELEEKFAERVEERATARLLAAAGAGTVCRDFLGGPRRSDGLVVRMRQLCRNGALLWASFEVENRRRPDVALEGATLADASGASSSQVHFEKRRLRFNEATVGVAGIPLTDGDVKPSTYSLTVVEDGGLSRQVVIDGIEF